jgi:hypothetical protein
VTAAPPGLAPDQANPSWHAEGAVKGRTAEAIVEELFRALKWNVYRFGWENTVPQTLSDFEGKGNDVAKKIRLQPDFVVYKRSSGTTIAKGPFYVEAKYRSDGLFSAADIGDAYPYPEAFFVIVTPRRIECITGQELKNGLSIDPDSDRFWFAKRGEFAADEKTVLDFVAVARKMFGGDVDPTWTQGKFKGLGIRRRLSR